jgi:hypothetical protein
VGSDEEDVARRQAYEQELINAMFESLQRRLEFEADIQTSPSNLPRTLLPQDATRT